jgi:hypothetical protein
VVTNIVDSNAWAGSCELHFPDTLACWLPVVLHWKEVRWQKEGGSFFQASASALGGGDHSTDSNSNGKSCHGW